MGEEGISRRDFSLAALFVAAGVVVPKPILDSINRLSEDTTQAEWHGGTVDEFAKFIAPFAKVKEYDYNLSFTRGFHYMVQVYSKEGTRLKGIYGAESTVEVKRKALADSRIDLLERANLAALTSLAKVVLEQNPGAYYKDVDGKLVKV